MTQASSDTARRSGMRLLHLVLSRSCHGAIFFTPRLPAGDYKILVRTEDGKHIPVKLLLGLYYHVEREVSLPKKLHRIRIPATI